MHELFTSRRLSKNIDVICVLEQTSMDKFIGRTPGLGIWDLGTSWEGWMKAGEKPRRVT